MFKNAIFVTLLAFCLYEEGLGADEVLRCPDSFRPDVVNTLTYKVNTTAIKEAECELKTRRLMFSIIRNASSDIICNIAYNCDSPGPVSDSPSGKDAECGCVGKSAEVWTFEVKVLVDKKKDTGARFGFIVCSGPLHPPSQDIQKSCTSITIEPQLTSTEVVSTSAKSTPNDDEPQLTSTEVVSTSAKSTPNDDGTPGGENGGLGTTVIVIIVVVVVVMVAVVIGIIVFMRKRGFRGMPVRT